MVRSRTAHELRRPCLALDFDHTITARHFFKSLAWGYCRATEEEHASHADVLALVEWCAARDLPVRLPRNYLEDGIHGALDYFDSMNCTRLLFRQFFMGGEQRIALLTRWLERQARYSQVLIITAGVASTVARVVATAIPEWICYFPSCCVFDLDDSEARWGCIHSLSMKKLLLVRDARPMSCSIILVDDSIGREKHDPWVINSTGSVLFEDLPYEGGGLTPRHMDKINAIVLGLRRANRPPWRSAVWPLAAAVAAAAMSVVLLYPWLSLPSLPALVPEGLVPPSWVGAPELRKQLTDDGADEMAAAAAGGGAGGGGGKVGEAPAGREGHKGEAKVAPEKAKRAEKAKKAAAR